MIILYLLLFAIVAIFVGLIWFGGASDQQKHKIKYPYKDDFIANKKDKNHKHWL